ncbi:MAG: hypothetical protein DRQ02_01740 [Candidatus Latescibacterota bacterium]|nr:MAG: hypothetical protein DRQ02_01740 [Candidatus Latescibacterota bacterium]RKY73804.1 MAG: hypothetical protein DRQ24_01595 [Candidatus Latescibacterota bacterium]
MVRMILLLVTTVVLISSSAARSDHALTMHREIKLSGEKLVKVKMEFGGGELRIGKTQGKMLLDADLEYAEEKLRPIVEYSREDTIGQLKLSMKGKRDRIGWKDFKSIWDLRFTEKIPFSFDVQMGANEAELDFSGLRVKALNIETGASKTTIRFNCPNKEVMEELKLTAGAAKLRAERLGNANFKQMEFEGGVGSYTLDFRGHLRQKSRVDISMGLGQLILLIPQEVGTKIDASEASLCAFSVGGFEREGTTYVNKNYGKTEAELVIHLECGLGSINIESVSGKGGD